MLKKLVVIMLISVSSLFGVNKFMLNISDLDVESGVDFDIGQFQEDYAIDTYFVGLSYLETNDNSTNSVLYGNFIVINDIPSREDARMGFGFKAVSTSLGNEKFLALAIGGVFDYSISEDGKFWKSSVYYAPGALSYRDARSYSEVRTGIHLEAIENVRVFFEGRIIHTLYVIAGKNIVNESVYGGIEIGF